ncbi:MAG: prephenate dehydrogenase/arogenate dehydrogenase family protein [Deltaproteobacteria bacterium]|nr:prephenate dehydrogenase/arogenate dehydrogenase family protein [Deltaproteobacteria bacterium]
MPAHFKKVAIIGVGLIGGSLAMAMKHKRMADTIVGIGRGTANLELAMRLGVVDSIALDIESGVAGADLVVVAVPVLKIGETIKKAASGLTSPCIITDVGSVKKAIIDECEAALPEGITYVPGHPIAGTESSGVEAAMANLYNERVCILTPTSNTPQSDIGKIREMWQEAGSKVVIMDAAAHDRLLSAISHLPHIIAYTLVNTVAAAGEKNIDFLKYSAGGFRDFTRIASSSPEMWADVCAMNKDNIIGMIENFQRQLEALKRLMAHDDFKGVKANFEGAKKIRDSITTDAKK